MHLRNNESYQVAAVEAARQPRHHTEPKYARGDWPITIYVRPR